MLGARVKKRKGNYTCPVPVLKELLVPMDVLISRLCNQRNLFFPVLKAQQRQSPPSHQSSKHSDPATTHTKSCEQFAFILQVWEGPFCSQDTQSYPEPAVWILGQTDLSHVQWQWRRINLPIGSVYRLITPPRCDIWRPCMTFLCI